MSKLKMRAFRGNLSNVRWNNVTSLHDINDAYNCFWSDFSALYDLHFQTKNATVRIRLPSQSPARDQEIYLCIKKKSQGVKNNNITQLSVQMILLFCKLYNQRSV
jgi:hypothetical protein